MGRVLYYLRIRIRIQHVLSLVCAERFETVLTPPQDVTDVPVFVPLPPRPRHHCALPSPPTPSVGHADSDKQGESDR